MSDDDQRVIDALMAAQRKNRKIIPCPECERLQDRNEVLEKSAEINRRIMDSYGPRFDEYDAEIERLQNELKTCCDHDNIWKHAQEMGFEKANNELQAENKRLQSALERIEQLDERMAPITNMVRAKEIAREVLEGE